MNTNYDNFFNILDQYSKTHTKDVYKRQTFIHHVWIIALRLVPVSYTHLDVYKRQD